jgi:uncharacterized protein YdeI (YjbR/CyaY-like superfamily)
MTLSPTFFENTESFRRWLERNAASAQELIVGFYKVGTGRPSMSWSESVDEALCFGWIDAVRKRIDDESYLIRFTRRKPTSIWSAVNIAKFHDLQAQGRIAPAGAAAFALRREDRSVVYAYEQESTAALSTQEVREFKRNGAAWEYWQTTPPSYRKVVLHRIVTAKKAETRAARLAKLIEASTAGKRWL